MLLPDGRHLDQHQVAAEVEVEVDLWEVAVLPGELPWPMLLLHALVHLRAVDKVLPWHKRTTY